MLFVLKLLEVCTFTIFKKNTQGFNSLDYYIAWGKNKLCDVWDNVEIEESESELSSAFGTLYSAFEKAALNPTSLEDAGFSGTWISEFVETAVANIIPPFVEIRGICSIEVGGSKGVEAIKEALIKAESHADLEKEITVNCFYDGAPKYRLEIRAPDYKLAESAWLKASKSLVSSVKSIEGTAEIERN